MTETAMITGGTAGIGLATVEPLGIQNCRIPLNGNLKSRAAGATAALRMECPH